LIDGILDNSSFDRLKKKYREQIGNFEDQIIKVDQSKNLKMDTIQHVLAITRNIGQTYREARPALKELYLNLFWHHFEAENRELTAAVKSPIVLALESAGMLSDNCLHEPIPSDYSQEEESVRLRDVRGRLLDTFRTLNWKAIELELGLLKNYFTAQQTASSPF
jgi:hypothetical protein